MYEYVYILIGIGILASPHTISLLSRYIIAAAGRPPLSLVSTSTHITSISSNIFSFKNVRRRKREIEIAAPGVILAHGRPYLVTFNFTSKTENDTSLRLRGL